jgi:enoyl-CoA hydratase/carnithine racemase
MDRDQWMLTSETSDFREGAAAFLQKRAPKFRGD